MLTDKTKPEDFRNIRGGDNSSIKGWGIDADPENDPTYPMKNRTNEEHKGYTWDRPKQQPVNIERPNITATFGTSVPPSGISGAIRRFAFMYSESSYLHWLPLMLADRVNVIEGLVKDIAQGNYPDIVSEKGWRMEMKYNKVAFFTDIAVKTVAISVIVALMLMKKKKRRKLIGF
jgi:hypothetical protein